VSEHGSTAAESDREESVERRALRILDLEAEVARLKKPNEFDEWMMDWPGDPAGDGVDVYLCRTFVPGSKFDNGTVTLRFVGVSGQFCMLQWDATGLRRLSKFLLDYAASIEKEIGLPQG
jgi:hypothetical protein